VAQGHSNSTQWMANLFYIDKQKHHKMPVSPRSGEMGIFLFLRKEFL